MSVNFIGFGLNCRHEILDNLPLKSFSTAECLYLFNKFVNVFKSILSKKKKKLESLTNRFSSCFAFLVSKDVWFEFGH